MSLKQLEMMYEIHYVSEPLVDVCFRNPTMELINTLRITSLKIAQVICDNNIINIVVGVLLL